MSETIIVRNEEEAEEAIEKFERYAAFAAEDPDTGLVAELEMVRRAHPHSE